MLTLEQIKAHCHLELDETEEDRLLLAYGRAAWRLVETSTGRRLFQVVLPEGAPVNAGADEVYLRGLLPPGAPENALPVTEDVSLAMLLLVAHWHRNREAVTESTATGSKKLPLAVDELLNPYRWFSL
ncbi:phage gp6-like head-tail connector protein [Pseudomonas sp. MSSRFD41]|uniref:head-tail connector protein n=1 Tax=Pseudomonas sp. MSSRFD41 TaxID=1310370 RepID=UPI00163A09BF|nr:head-tail connector protein [Pseudomonas sp. MSSRFD41]MBC2655088.1 phage gp6-like head-tail connector protein [Pseudomonas sp. MSSRFD41]